MGLFEDFSKFLETRLDEFLRNNPHLELQALEEQLREQEDGTLRLILDLQRQEKKLQEDILAIAQDIQRWHERASKAQAAGRTDLAEEARQREAALLRQGNQTWGQMQGLQQRIEQAKNIARQTQRKREEVKARLARARAERAQQKAAPDSQTTGWNQASRYSSYRSSKAADPLEEKFQQWEMDDELEQMKRNLNQ